MKTFLASCIILSGILGLALFPSAGAAEWAPLFNGTDLAGWDTSLARTTRGGTNYGLNRDPEKVFTAERTDGGPAIRISGKYWGGLITKQEFENYHLQLEFKWGTQTWPPRFQQTPDSGLLYHCVGPLDANSGSAWPRSIEFNISQHDTGEFWSVDKTIVEAEVVPIGNTPAELEAFKGWCQRNEAEGPRVKFQKGGQKQTFRDGGFMPAGDFEKPAGQWNTLDLYAVGDCSVHVVNGNVALVLTGLRQKVGSREVPLTKGRIELQSEGAEIFFRNIRLQPITAIPQSLLE